MLDAIQVGKGPWANEVSGIVRIGQTMTLVLAIKDEENKFDMMVRNCIAHDGNRAPIELVDSSGCVTRPKLMSRFTKVKNFGSSASVLSFAHFQAFKFPDSTEVHIQCTVQICRQQCEDQCSIHRRKRQAGKGEVREIGLNSVLQVVAVEDLTFHHLRT
ncbi:ZP domain-containing protein [Trichonephila clavata]|uniref:ZP domain-containing protein n=1 Tax=Trichonephila clavata TaxID=2740835 RepID=A0A8X6FRT2_TRICU|nr:ZP domain-containing protein [Trichonephila clavata]